MPNPGLDTQMPLKQVGPLITQTFVNRYGPWRHRGPLTGFDPQLVTAKGHNPRQSPPDPKPAPKVPFPSTQDSRCSLLQGPVEKTPLLALHDVQDFHCVGSLLFFL